MNRKPILFCLVGPAGGGKTTLAERLLKQFSGTIRVSISATSRAARPGEIDGKSYHFLSRQEFETRVARDEFFEWEDNHGNLYGTLKSTVEHALTGTEDLLLVVDIRGSITIKKTFPDDTVIVFLTPPSYKELIARLDARGALDPVERACRLRTTERELSTLKESVATGGLIDYLIVNDDLGRAEQELFAVVRGEGLKLKRSAAAVIESITSLDKG